MCLFICKYLVSNSTFEGEKAVYLKYEMPVCGQLKVHILVVQMLSESYQEFVLSVDVCSQDERTQLLLYVLPVQLRKTNQ